MKASPILLTIGTIILIIGFGMTVSGIPLAIIDVNAGPVNVRAEGLTSGQATIIIIGALFLGFGALLRRNKN